MTLRLAASVTLTLLLAACVPPPTTSAPTPAPAPAPAPSPAPAPVASAAPLAQPVATDWVHAPLTPGDWSWRRAGGQSFAEFSSPQGRQLAQFTCTADREILLAVASPAANGLMVRTETASRTVAADAREGWVETRFPAADSLLDAIAFSRGRFAVEAGGMGFYLPSYPEITRVIEDCR